MASNTGTAVGYSSANITSQATTLVKSGVGILQSLIFNKPTATAVITLYDGIDANGTKLGTITIPASPQPFTLKYERAVTTGITVVTATADSDITVTFI